MKRLTVVLLVILGGLAGSWLVGRAPRATTGIHAESRMGGTVSGDAGIAIEPVSAPSSRTGVSRPVGAHTVEIVPSESKVEARSIADFPARPADTTGVLDLRVTWTDGTAAVQVSTQNLARHVDCTDREVEGATVAACVSVSFAESASQNQSQGGLDAKV